eukprot:CAMPEP_0194174954 /NCGR_PEP_ID=MMETSP0154-20130528/9080_1 /TAXON_ID=1049557 /ORGANISM="Thalassiothrix antarctica, Strain L6-D1" /LENGTH=191 /DNA_ID=CAMNT_0038888585 /DNA_START=66 /DNA_END=641 /DNA_ORIENTATION=+
MTTKLMVGTKQPSLLLIRRQLASLEAAATTTTKFMGRGVRRDPLGLRRRWTMDNPMRRKRSTLRDIIEGTAVVSMCALVVITFGGLYLIRKSENGMPYLIRADPQGPEQMEELPDLLLFKLEWFRIMEGVKIGGNPLYTRRPGELSASMYRIQLAEKRQKEAEEEEQQQRQQKREMILERRNKRQQQQKKN